MAGNSPLDQCVTTAGHEIRYVGGGGEAVLLRQANAPVEALRYTTTDFGPVVFASWDERAGSSRERWVSVSRDGGRSFLPARRIDSTVRLVAGRIGEDGIAPTLPAGLSGSGSGNLAIIQFRTMSIPEWRSRLAEIGAEVLAFVPENAHIVRLSAGASADVIAAEPFVLRILPFEAGYRLTPGLVGEIAQGTELTVSRRFNLRTWTPDARMRGQLATDVARVGGQVLTLPGSGYRIEARLTLDQLRRLAFSDSLQWADPWQPPSDDMDVGRAQCGADYVETMMGFDGSGVRGEVLDGGTLMTHQDFDGVLPHGTVNAGDHGTCTYGIVFGNGNRDGDGDAQATGMLPLAQGYAADYSALGDRYLHTQELVQSPIFASFQSNSWGSGLTTLYNSISAEMDDIIWIHDIPIFQSQSNAGSRDSRPQAWAKNIISVGALVHQNTAALTDDCWCGGASIGPAEDGRIKPDLAFWYDGIYSTDNEPGGYSAGLYTPGFGGTSAATPMTAGTGGLFLEMWAANILGNNPPGTTVFEKRPHASTTKALMINTAEPYDFTGPAHDLSRVHQGWGLPSARRFFDRRSLMHVIDESSPLEVGGVDVYRAAVSAGQAELKVSMVYTDRAAAPLAAVHRVNDVSLRVTAPDGTDYFGNVGLTDGNWSTPGGGSNSIDTVENVWIQNPMAGDWIVAVSAEEVNQEQHNETPEVDQDYALVVYGSTSLNDCGSSVPTPTAVSATAAGNNAIRLNWSGSASVYHIYRRTFGCGGAMQEFAVVPGPTTTWLDTTVSGSITYGYAVRAEQAGCESDNSACVTGVTTGRCDFGPGFTGLTLAAGTGSATCGIALSWPAATRVCPGPIVYNVYRSTTPGFVPNATNLHAACQSGTSLLDRRGVVDGTRYYYIVRAEDQGATGAGRCGGLEDTNSIELSASAMGLVLSEFESGLDGWTTAAGSPPASSGNWIGGDPEGTTDGANQAQPETGQSGIGCLFSARNPSLGAGADDVDGGEVVALSPSFDATVSASVTLRFWRWFYNRDVGEDAGDYFAVDVSNDDGSNWTNLETLGTADNANTWVERTFTLQTALPLTNRMRLRIRAADGTSSGNIIEAAVDAVRVSASGTCTTAAVQPGVVTGSGGAPLFGVRRGANAHFQWGTDCGGTARYGFYEGNLLTKLSSLAIYPGDPGSCSLAVNQIDVPLGPGKLFYLISPNDGAVEGSLGLLNLGLRRPQAAVPCYPRSVDPCAP